MCPNDENKLQPGICGCGKPDVDSDEDGILNCKDSCPDDATIPVRQHLRTLLMALNRMYQILPKKLQREKRKAKVWQRS